MLTSDVCFLNFKHAHAHDIRRGRGPLRAAGWSGYYRLRYTPDKAMKEAPLAVAAALTSVVLLHPGGPCSSTPLQSSQASR